MTDDTASRYTEIADECDALRARLEAEQQERTRLYGIINAQKANGGWRKELQRLRNEIHRRKWEFGKVVEERDGYRDQVRRMLAVEPEDAATASRDYGRGYAQAIRDVHAAAADETGCVCTVGAQECPVHPGNAWTQEEKVAFRKAWDERVAR